MRKAIGRTDPQSGASTSGYVIRTKDCPIGIINTHRFTPSSLTGAPATGLVDISTREALPIDVSASQIKFAFDTKNNTGGHKTTLTTPGAPANKMTMRVMDFTPTGSVYSGSVTNVSFQAKGSDSVPVSFCAPFGLGSSVEVSEWVTKAVTAGSRLGVEVNWEGCFQNAQNGVTPTFPAQAFPAATGTLAAALTENGAQPASRTQTSGNLSIAGTGTPTATGSQGVSMPFAIIGKDLSGLTRPPVCTYLGNSIMGDDIGSPVHMMRGFGWQVFSWGASGSAPDANWENSALDYRIDLSDFVIMNDCENFLNPTYVGFAAFFGSSTSTNSQPLIDAQLKAVKKWGKPTFWVLPYLLGLNTANLAAQAIGPGTINSTAYGIALDYRTKVKALLAANPEYGTCIDVYGDQGGQLIVDQSIAVPALPFIYKSTLLADGSTRGIKAWELDTANVSGGVPTTSNIFVFQLDATSPFPTNTLMRTSLTGVADLPGPNNAGRLTVKQYQYFGNGTASLDGPQTSLLQNAKFGGSVLYCYAGVGGGNTPIGQFRTTTGNLFTPFGRANMFTVNNIAPGTITYANSWWRMEVPIVGDNNGSAVATNGLHLNLPPITVSWIIAFEKTIRPIVNSWARMA
jgi:hypothetical protein